MPKARNPNCVFVLNFEFYWNFEFVSDFELRISDVKRSSRTSSRNAGGGQRGRSP
jgi:hypothetical protein